MLLGIRHSGYIVSDIDVSRQFYETVLGFEVMQAFEDSSDYINDITCTTDAVVKMVKMKSLDGSVIEILSYKGGVPPTTKPRVPIYNVGEAHLAIQVDDADKFHKHLNIIKLINHKICEDINEIIQTFRRYNYTVISEHKDDFYLQDLKERSDYLQKYLNM